MATDVIQRSVVPVISSLSVKPREAPGSCDPAEAEDQIVSLTQLAGATEFLLGQGTVVRMELVEERRPVQAVSGNPEEFSGRLRQVDPAVVHGVEPADQRLLVRLEQTGQRYQHRAAYGRVRRASQERNIWRMIVCFSRPSDLARAQPEGLAAVRAARPLTHQVTSSLQGTLTSGAR
jgi:hypothetical protein